MNTIMIGSELSYDVRQPTVLLFKISAANTPHQKLISEGLYFNPQLQVETLDFGSDGHRGNPDLVQPCKVQSS